MGIRENRPEIDAFLAKAKELLESGDYDFVPRRRNLQALAAIGFTIKDAKTEIAELTAEDYHKGPKADFDSARGGEIWEFKKNVEGMQFYVKLKIQDAGGKDVLKCLSFHEDDFASGEEE